MTKRLFFLKIILGSLLLSASSLGAYDLHKIRNPLGGELDTSQQPAKADPGYIIILPNKINLILLLDIVFEKVHMVNLAIGDDHIYEQGNLTGYILHHVCVYICVLMFLF